MRDLGTRRVATCMAAYSSLWLLACNAVPSDESAEFREGFLVMGFQDGQLPTSSYVGARDTMLEGGSPGAKNGGDASLSAWATNTSPSASHAADGHSASSG